MIALFGWRIHEAILGLIGFFIGGIIVGLLGVLIAGSSSDAAFLFGVGGFFLGGIAGWKLILLYERMSVGLVAGLSGAILIGQLTKQVIVTYSNSQYCFLGLCSNFSIPTTRIEYNYPAIAFGFIAFAIIGWLFYKIAWILGTTALGAGIVTLGTASLSPDASGAVGIITFLIGLVVQGQEFAKKNNTTLTKEVEKFIQSPGLPRNPAAAPSQNATESLGSTSQGLSGTSKTLGTTLESLKPILVQYFGENYSLPLALGMLFYALSVLVFLALSNYLVIGSAIFLILGWMAINRLKREQFKEAKPLVLIAGIFGLVFGLLIGGACFLYVYAEISSPDKTASGVLAPRLRNPDLN